MTEHITVSRLHFPVTTLGPGRRVGIWFQGCSIRCPGCISMDTWSTNRGATTITEVLTAVSRWLAEADGVTISGGEPFDQADALIQLLRGIRSASEADILVFTGYPWGRISKLVSPLGGLIDAIVAGPFDRNEKQTLALRGSDNQTLHLLTAKGRERFETYERMATETDRTIDVMFDESGDVWFAGIPARDDFRRLQEMLERTGATLATSEDKADSSRQVHSL